MKKQIKNVVANRSSSDFISKFSFYKRPISNTIPKGEMSIQGAHYQIRSENYKEETEKLRKINDPREAKEFKNKNFDFVTISGCFNYRNGNALLKHSNLLALDIDHISNIPEIKEKLLNDKYLEIELMFISPSGDGLKCVVRIDVSSYTHQEWFCALSNYLKEIFNVEVDQSGKDIARACFLPYDPEAYIKPKTLVKKELFPVRSWLSHSEIETKQSIDSSKDPETEIDIEVIISRIEETGTDITSNYHDWVRIGYAFANDIGEDGREYFHRISQFYQGYSYEECDKLYDDCLKTKGQRIRLGSFFFIAKSHGIDIDCRSSAEDDFRPYFEVDESSMDNEASNITIEKQPPIKLLPIIGMPEPIKEYVTTCSETFNTPRDFWAGAAIICIGLAIGDKIQLKTRYNNVPILWMNCIGDVSSGKTEAMDFTMKTFEELDSIAVDQFKKDYQEYDAIESMSATERKVEGIDRKVRPKCFQYIVKDSTPEALSQVHSINQRGIMINRDELKGWIDDFGRYSKNGEQSNMLSSYNGIRMVTNRKGGGVDSVLEIPRPCIFVLGGMQPDLIPTLAADNRSENGFLARFCNVWPDDTPKPMYNKSVVPELIKQNWKDIVLKLIRIPETIDISLSPQAEKLYQEWFNRNADISNSEKSGYLKGVYGKLDIIALRLAIIIYGMNIACENLSRFEISSCEMKSALEITEYFRGTALKVYNKIFNDSKLVDKKLIIKYLSEMGHSQTKIAEIMKVSQPYVNKVL